MPLPVPCWVSLQGRKCNTCKHELMVPRGCRRLGPGAAKPGRAGAQNSVDPATGQKASAARATNWLVCKAHAWFWGRVGYTDMPESKDQ